MNKYRIFFLCWMLKYNKQNEWTVDVLLSFLFCVHTYCTMLRVFDHFWTSDVACYATEDAVRIVTSFITISHT
jgi:hypothetical protein